MKRLFFLLIAVGCALQIRGQMDSLIPGEVVQRMPPPIRTIPPSSALKVQTEAWMYSQRMPAGMLYPFMGGGISNEIIRKSSERIGDAQSHLQGQAGILVQFDDFAHHLIPSKKISWSYQYAYTNLYASRFDQPAFDLVFRGNAPFAGRILESRDLRFNTMSWNRLGTQATWRPTNSRITYRAGANWVFMRNYQDLRLPSGSLFTSSVGDSVFMNYDLDYTRKDRNANDFYDLSHGFSTQFGISGTRPVFNRALSWFVEVQDLGLVSLGKRASRYQAEQGVQVFGWNVPFTPYGIDSTASFRNYFDTLLNKLHPARSDVSGWVMLPARFRAEIVTLIGPKSAMLRARLEYRMYPGFIPRASLEYTKNLNQKRSVQMHVTTAYGGVPNGDIGLGFSYRPWSSLWIQAHAISVEGLVLPGKTGGAGGLLQASMRF
jgi:hypothetical protein